MQTNQEWRQLQPPTLEAPRFTASQAPIMWPVFKTALKVDDTPREIPDGGTRSLAPTWEVRVATDRN